MTDVRMKRTLSVNSLLQRRDSENDLHIMQNQFREYNFVHFGGLSIHKKNIRCVALLLVLILLLLVGGGIIQLIEYDEEAERIKQEVIAYENNKTEIINILYNVTQNMTETIDIYQKLQQNSFGFFEEPSKQNDWNIASSIMFCFTIITTIGYGTFTPATLSGHLFVVFYGLIGIPITAVALASISERVLYFFTWVSRLGKDKIEEAFHHFDGDCSGMLEPNEFQSAVKELGYELSNEEFAKLWGKVDKENGGTVDLEEFRYAVKLMHADVTEAAGRKSKIMITLWAICIWLVIGALIFKYIENWSYEVAIYFLYVTFATIGFGDYAPETRFGYIFLIAFSFVGLGLVAIMISLLQEIYHKVQDKGTQMIVEQRDCTNSIKKLRGISLFEKFKDQELKELAKQAEEIGSFIEIIKEGDQLDLVYLLLDGRVIVRAAKSDGPKILSAPSIIFESTILNSQMSYIAEATVCTVEKTDIIKLPFAVVDALLPKIKEKNTGDTKMYQGIVGMSVHPNTHKIVTFDNEKIENCD